MPEHSGLEKSNLVRNLFLEGSQAVWYSTVQYIYHSIGTIGSGIIQYKSTVSVGNSNLQSDMVVAVSVKDGKILS